MAFNILQKFSDENFRQKTTGRVEWLFFGLLYNIGGWVVGYVQVEDILKQLSIHSYMEKTIVKMLEIREKRKRKMVAYKN